MIPRVNFIWGASDQIKARWHLGWFGFYERTPGFPESGLAISLRGTLVWTTVMAAVAWTGLATGLHYVWKRDAKGRMTYQDALLYPFRRTSVAVKQGEALIDRGKELWQQRKFAEAATLIRLGFAKGADDREARLHLAEFLVITRRWPQAIITLRDGIGRSYPGRAYLKAFFELAARGEDYAAIIAACDQVGSGMSPEDVRRDGRWLGEQKFTALLAAGHIEQALGVAERSFQPNTRIEQTALALLAGNRAKDLVNLLTRELENPAAEPALVYRFLVRACREAGDAEKMGDALRRFRAVTSNRPEELVFGIAQLAMAGETTAAEAALADYVFRHGSSIGNILLAAEPLAQIGQSSLVKHCATAAKERGYAMDRLNNAIVEAAIRRAAWEEAKEALKLLSTIRRSPDGSDTMATAWLDRLVRAALDPSEAAQRALLEHVRQSPPSIGIYRGTIEALTRANRFDSALRVCELAAGCFPASEWLQAQHDELRQKAGGAPRKPEPVSKVQTWTRPKGDAFFSEIERLIAAHEWAKAAAMLHEARGFEPLPPWLTRRDADLRFAQMRVDHARGENAAMLAHAQIYLNGELARSEKALGFARLILAEHDPALAIRLVEDICRVTPQFTEAKAAFEAWRMTPHKP
ncbi:MAG: hypothetical protein HZA93_02890 [Verrucomicrobia bacterium]|nr:hypothetical protein [Verrucomicrobiota bacterium]